MPANECYPDRPKCFALYFIREMLDARVSGNLGDEVFTLLVAVVMQEDAVRYRRPVNFFNDQLRDRCGGWSESKLDRARKRAVDAGWLYYRQGHYKEPGVYWVRSCYHPGCDPPVEKFSGGGGGRGEETPTKPRGNDAHAPTRDVPISEGVSAGVSGGSPQASPRASPQTHHSYPVPSDPALSEWGAKRGLAKSVGPRTEDRTETDPTLDPRFLQLSHAYPRKDNQHGAAVAFAELAPDDELLGKMLAAVEAQKQSREWAKQGGQFIPHLSNWIRGRRWGDRAAATELVCPSDRRPWQAPSDPPGTKYTSPFRGQAPLTSATATSSGVKI